MVAVSLPPTTLPATVADGGTVVFGYPAGFTQADFVAEQTLARGQVAINDNDVYEEASGDVVIGYETLSVLVRNETGLAWPEGATVRVSLARLDPIVGGSEPADAVAVAGGVSTAFAPIVSQHFWRMQQALGAETPFRVDLSGTEHSLNLLMAGVDAAVTWSVGPIAAGLEGAEGRIVFENGGAFERACAPDDGDPGAVVRYADGVVAGDLVLPAGAGSRLVVFYEIIADGGAGLVEITGIRTTTVAP